MRKWYQKSMAVLTAAVCLFAGGTIGLARDSLPQLQLTAEAADKTYIWSAYGLQLEYEELEDGTVEITKFVSSTSTDIELPSVIDGKSVTSIGESAFDVDVVGACRNLTSIIIPDSVTSIGARAFFKCNSLI
ncbi:MAG: leucine-rich repeat protein, partial [Ruminococcus sp.]|nr:leucine-rich repeat protein [Ruminococcus sp.]